MAVTHYCIAALVVVACLAASVQAQANLGLSMPLKAFNGALTTAAQTVANDLNNVALPTCCYDDVGAKHVHLDMQDMKISGSTVTFSIVKSSSTTYALNGAVSMTVSGSYRLCIHDDPFGHGCSTIKGCKGDWQLQPDFSFSMPINMEAATSGAPKITPGTVTIPTYTLNNNFCSLFSDAISKGLDGMKANLAQSLQSAAVNVAAKLQAAIPQTVNAGKLGQMSLNYLVPASGGLTNLDTAAVAGFAAAAPRAQAGTMPNIDDGYYHITVGDSLLTSAFDTIVAEGLFNVTIKEDGLVLGLTFVRSVPPQVNISSNEFTVMLGLHYDLSDNGTHSSGDIILQAGIDTKFSAGANQTIVLQLALTNATNVGMGPNCQGACEIVVQTIRKYQAPIINGINNYLQDKPVVFPAPPSDMSSVSIDVVPNYLDLSVMINSAALGHTLAAAIRPAVLGAIQCPAIPNAHTDSCI